MHVSASLSLLSVARYRPGGFYTISVDPRTRCKDKFSQSGGRQKKPWNCDTNIQYVEMRILSDWVQNKGFTWDILVFRIFGSVAPSGDKNSTSKYFIFLLLNVCELQISRNFRKIHQISCMFTTNNYMNCSYYNRHFHKCFSFIQFILLRCILASRWKAKQTDGTSSRAHVNKPHVSHRCGGRLTEGSKVTALRWSHNALESWERQI